MKPKKVLYISWDGYGQDYISSLFMPVLRDLQQFEFNVDILQCLPSPFEFQPERLKRIEDEGLQLLTVPIPQFDSRISKLRAVLSAMKIMRSLERKGELDLVVPRSILGAIVALPLVLRRKVPVCFDLDGSMLQERIDLSGWRRRSLKVWVLATIERLTIKRSASLIVRSNRARDALLHAYGSIPPERIFIARNGRDPKVFRPLSETARTNVRKKLGFEGDSLVFVYVGSADENRYHFSKILDLIRNATAINPKSRLLVITASKEFAQRKIEQSELSAVTHCLTVLPHEVGEMLGACDVGVSLIDQSESMRMISPIKIGEYLLAGLLVTSTTGIGDIDEILADLPTVWLKDLSASSIEEAAISAVQLASSRSKEDINRTRDIGMKFFSHEQTVEAYRCAFEHALEPPC